MIYKLDKAVELAVKIDGWMDRDELAWLYERASELPTGGIWVEVGCWKGRSFLVTALGLPPRTEIHAVDTWKGDYSSKGHWEAREIPGWLRWNFDLVTKAIGSIRQQDRISVHTHALPSQQAANFFDDGSVDGVFIDACHDYRNVINDLTVWKPKLKKGGLLCGHDYAYEEVARAVEELLPNFELGPKTIWFARV